MKPPPPAKVPPAKAPQPLAQTVQQVHGPKVAMPQQPLAQPVSQVQSPTVVVQTMMKAPPTKALIRGNHVKAYLHEIAVDETSGTF